jgi:hypothetical protein
MRGKVRLLLLVACTLPLAALDWPVNQKIVTGNFGENRIDHFQAGIDIGGGEQEVRSILDGELIFRYEEDADYSSLPRGVGSFAALRHPADIISLYCHLKKDSFPRERTLFKGGDRLGIVGDTGYSDGKRLNLEIFDVETASYINPLSILPPLADRQRPVIRGISLEIGQTVVQMKNGVLLPSGKGEFRAELYDPREDVRFLRPMAPYSVSIALNGKELSKIVFDSLQVKNGRMVVVGPALGVNDVYTPDGLVRCGTVELRGGESHLLLSVSDFAGNRTEKEIFFTVAQ